MKKQVKRYTFAIAAAAAFIALLIIIPEKGAKAGEYALFSVKEMATVLPPIFILLGLLDAWVPRETMVRFMGEGSGIKGALLALFLGTAAAGPLYAAFPVAAVLMKKGAAFSNVMIFMGAWSTTKIPMLLFELNSMGALFMLTRLGMSLIGIAAIAAIVSRSMSAGELEVIYKKAAER